MKKMMPLFALVAMMGFAVTAFAAAEKAEKKEAGKEQTVTGTMKCAKCALKEQDKCQAVVVATEEGKEVKYFLVGPGAAAAHKEICKEDKPGVTKTGKVAEKDGKKELTVAAEPK